MAQQKGPAILVFSKTAGYRHDCIAAGKLAMLKLGAVHGYRVDTTENSSSFTAANLKKYNVVVFLCTTGTVLDTLQKEAFKKYIQAGGGFVGIHSATDTEYSWPWVRRTDVSSWICIGTMACIVAASAYCDRTPSTSIICLCTARKRSSDVPDWRSRSRRWRTGSAPAACNCRPWSTHCTKSC